MRDAIVETLHDAIRLSPSKTPYLTLVLPMSIVRIILYLSCASVHTVRNVTLNLQ